MTITSITTARKLRDMAEKLQPQIDGAFAERQENTAKRVYQAANARNEGYRLRRTQQAMIGLAALHETEKVPTPLLKVTSKKAIYEAMASKMEDGTNGHYSAPRDSGVPRYNSDVALALWALIEARNAADDKDEELHRKIAGLKFARIPGYFPTPPEVVARMVEKLNLDPEKQYAILEPSAGSGAIADHIFQKCRNAVVQCFEINHTLNSILKSKGHQVIGKDFLEGDGAWSRIIMNPPFENMQDIDHILKAYRLLIPGGRLVAIMSPGPFFNDRARAVDFREWFFSNGGEVEDLPSGTFKQSGTGVASKLIVVDKPDDEPMTAESMTTCEGMVQ